ncbi:MAG: DegV family protein [Tepidiformaceae bacterium]
MKQRVAIVTDSCCELAPDEAARGNIFIAPAKFAFEQRAVADGALPWPEFYARMAGAEEIPQTFGTSEDDFIAAFEAAFEQGDEVMCLLTPFDVSPSYTTATAAAIGFKAGMVSIENPGIASAGLGALLLSLADGVAAGWSRTEVAEAIDRIEPMTETIFVPGSVAWLERSGRLALIEDRLGPIGDRTPVLRAGTRLTGLAVCESHDAALARAVALAGARAPDGTALIAVVAHAGAPEAAERVHQQLAGRWNIARASTSDLTSTIGSQLGPGAIGIGVAPVAIPEER